jgi:hypothetical protein
MPRLINNYNIPYLLHYVMDHYHSVASKQMNKMEQRSRAIWKNIIHIDKRDKNHNIQASWSSGMIPALGDPKKLAGGPAFESRWSP